MNFENHGPWIRAEGPHHDVVISSRARVARNMLGFPFVNRASSLQRREILRRARDVISESQLASTEMAWVDLNDASERDRRLLVERHLISKVLSESEIERAVAISDDESLSIMVNEEDHLRMQMLAPGLQLDRVYEQIDHVDDAIERCMDFAFSRRWGYLTACPTNVGTGIRFSVMMHLPAMKLTNEIEKVRRAAKDMHLAVRGYYGEGSESAGDFYQISNQLTLGRTESDLLHELQDRILPKIIDYEHYARRQLVERRTTFLEDWIYRALGLLRSARLLKVDEAMKYLSRVRLGVHLGRLPDLDPNLVNRLFLQVQPAHLQYEAQRPLSGESLRAARAALVRGVLGG